MDDEPESLQAAIGATRPDLPKLEDDAPPKGRKLVMSRELRGWMAGFAALAVGLAAVAPYIDAADLPGAIGLASVGDVASELTCEDEDQSGGLGGQRVKCTFTCPDRPGSVKVFVDADDPDAQVSGDASCGSDNAHCSAHNSCENTEPRTASGVGTCSADSDEAVDSGLYVECTADEAETIEPGDISGSDDCYLSRPVPVCTQPACAQFDGMKPAAACQKVWTTIVPKLTSTTTIVAFIPGEGGAGLGCQGFVCVPFEPICVNLAGKTTCFAP